MLVPGLVSVSFRDMDVDRIIELCARAGLLGIEWGGDVHVPHGDLRRAAETREKTLAAGLEIAAYGSYYRVGHSEEEGLPFEDVLASARALDAPTIRVWAGRIGSAEADSEQRQRVIDDSRRIADMASADGISVAYEYHAVTLTDTNDSAALLLKEARHPSIRTFWQPPNGKDHTYCMDGLKRCIDSGKLESVHVFYHWPGKERLPLVQGEAQWLGYLELVRQTPGRHYLCLEFFMDDDPEQMMADATTLNRWLKEPSA